jgi:RNA polymerase sigma-70 factor (ECF subfamily)
MTSEIKDKILYLRLKKKDKEAFVKAYDLYLDDIYRFVYFKVKSKEEAEDLTSMVFMKSWDYIQTNSITEFKTLKALFYKIARNAVIDHYRKSATKLNVAWNEEIDVEDESQDVGRQVEAITDFGLLASKMDALKPEYKEAITMRYVNELSIKEIADILGKTPGTVRVLVHRATNSLKKLAEEEL